MRIYYQSFLDREHQPSYFERLGQFLDSVADPGTEIEVGGISPPDSHPCRLSELRGGLQAVDKIIEAAERGFDAAIIGHFQDAGLYEARTAVDIPVLGLGEASLLNAGQLGRGIGLVTIDDVYLSWHREQADVYGIPDRLIGVTALKTPFEDLMAAFDDAEVWARVRDEFIACARPLVAAGAEVILSAGGIFCTLSAREPEMTVDGAVVPNSVAWVTKLAEVAVKLDLRPSRRGTYAMAPPAAIAEFRAAAAGIGAR
ncbi:MAG TPA: aspartate/glutamate racemase family protein [Solirubrobacterales bacterium]|jgi:Asp/Glu/hydantoin racemase